MTNTTAKRVATIIIAAIISAAMLIPTSANAMTSNQKAAESEILAGMANHETQIDLEDYNLTEKQMHQVNEDIYYQQPEAYYVKSFSYGKYKSGKIAYSKPSYTMNKNQIAAADKQIDKAIASCKVKGSTAKKVKQINKWLAKRTSYSTGASNKYNMYGALVGKKAVCMGYAMAFKAICDENNITCEVVMNKDGSHAWNQVKIGKTWYNVDVTWNDKGKKAGTKYLLVKDKKLAKKNRNHTGHKCKKNYNLKKIK